MAISLIRTSSITARYDSTQTEIVSAMQAVADDSADDQPAPIPNGEFQAPRGTPFQGGMHAIERRLRSRLGLHASNVGGKPRQAARLLELDGIARGPYRDRRF